MAVTADIRLCDLRILFAHYEEPQREKEKKGLLMKKLRSVFLLVASTIFLASGGYLLFDYPVLVRDRQNLEKLAEILEQHTYVEKEAHKMPAVAQEHPYRFLEMIFVTRAIAEESTYVTEQYILAEARMSQNEEIDPRMEAEHTAILPQYEALYAMNPDMVGWIKIEGILVDYPVMQTPGDNEFYLHRDFEKEYSFSGLPFIDNRCDIGEPTNNLLIYGHNMKNGTMFGQLPKFKSKSFWKKHRTIQMDLLYETRTYEIVSVFLSRQYKKGQKGFRYYDYIDLSDRDRFAEYIEQVKKASLFDTGVSADWGDNILTLSTCSYHVDAGTLVVVAKYQPQN